MILASAVVLTLLAALAMRRWGLLRPNFRGKLIPAGYGFMLVLVAVPLYAWSGSWTYLAAVAGFGLLGLIDDLYGTREAGGFGGHLGLLRRGRVSTGLVKAAGGGLLALALGLYLAEFRAWPGVLNGMVIALSANLLNLLDLRPGRAASLFWAGLVAVSAGSAQTFWRLVPVAVPAVWLTALDRSARVMMGDAGSNVLGAVLGLAVVERLSPGGRAAVFLALVAVHLFSERYSISRLIEGNRVLRTVDGLLG
ncbi:MAG: hypothetical protein ACYC4F_09760, partial [Armatimonadota bacterium]